MKAHDALVTWLQGIDNEECQDIIFLACSHVPAFIESFPRQDWGASFPEQFFADLADWFNVTTNPHELLAKIVTIRGLVGHLITLRSDPAHWQQAIVDNQQMLEFFVREEGNDGDKVKLLVGILEKLPVRAKKWEVIGPSWSELLDTHLSDRNLNRWLLSQLSSQLKSH